VIIGRAQDDALGGGNFRLQPQRVRKARNLIMLAIAKGEVIFSMVK
jgi:hypothetical protein